MSKQKGNDYHKEGDGKPPGAHEWKPHYHTISHIEYYSGEPDELKYLGPVKPGKVDYCRIIKLLLPHCGSERKIFLLVLTHDAR